MVVELDKIEVEQYEQHREQMLDLVKKIWLPQEFDNARDSIERWGKSKKESGGYFYILSDNHLIGITGYYLINQVNGDYGLRHHGSAVKGMGRPALDQLVVYIKDHHPDFKRLIEQIHGGREDLIPLFEGWGFHLIDSDQNWEPKKDQYKYVMAREGT